MITSKKIATCFAVIGTMLSVATSSASAAPNDGANLGECYNNWISYCNGHAPNGGVTSCHTQSLDRCDKIHKATMSQIPGSQIKAMRANALKRVTPARASVR